jgi:hypothetical protein
MSSEYPDHQIVKFDMSYTMNNKGIRRERVMGKVGQPGSERTPGALGWDQGGSRGQSRPGAGGEGWGRVVQGSGQGLFILFIYLFKFLIK